MLKLLLTLVVVGLALMVWFGKGRRRAAGGLTRSRPPVAPQAMLRCVHCAVHLPRQDAFLDDTGRPFCSAEHRHLGPRSGRAA